MFSFLLCLTPMLVIYHSRRNTTDKERPGFICSKGMASLSLSESSPARTHPVAAPQEPNKPSLANLPFEIKRWIVYWLNDLEKQDDPFDSDDSDIEEVDDDEFTDKKPPSRKSNHHNIPTPSQIANLFDFPPTCPSPSSSQQSKFQLNSIHSLALVDRTFYEICRPFIWQTLDLENDDLSKLKLLRTGVLTRQADYVRRIWWRVSMTELDEYEPEGWMGANEEKNPSQTTHEWDESARSSELLEILKMCTKTIDLDVDLRPAALDEHQQFIIQPLEPTSKFLEPITQLTQLTSISLTAPSNGPPFSEPFLVRLIKDMVHLKSFTCCLINAEAPDFENSNSITVCESPLALHLSRLSSLKEIDLHQADCFDLSWSTIEWAASLPALQAFCQKFASTLCTLELTDVPYDQGIFESGEATRTIRELGTGDYRFELPRLTTLSISNELPMAFLESFRECKNLKLFELAPSPSITTTDIERLTSSDFWPLLEKVTIATANSALSPGQLEALELFFLRKSFDEVCVV
ncbi:hypothetical protein VP01_510g1 [Puccinia sorghi]|uniref:F-box domain-containing protein n=1 Tax=Puccinia sorghi TaxID=27349 RepID=A0A0L6UL65_9BASI|nr:hypothetical protein VP01_510g1 [Puccinia sorghi]